MRSAERAPRSNTTLRACLRAAARQLEAARLSYGHGTTNARDEAAWLVLHALGLPFDDLKPNLERALSAQEQQAVATLVGERIRSRKPAAYLTREAWLGEHRFYVDERVIVPRSYIAELLRLGLGPWVEPARVRSALDLCTGSGCLAILVALAFPNARVQGADISRKALEVAKRNVADYGLTERVTLVRSDLYTALRGQTYDLIVSNPPYVRDAVMRRLPTEYRREPMIALAGGADGLDYVRTILNEASSHLTEDGTLVVETGHNRQRVERAFPSLPLIWPETSGGSDCVFMITREALVSVAQAARFPRASRSAALPRRKAEPRPARASAAAGVRRRRIARGSGG